MSEFSIIERFCHGLGQQHDSTVVGVGDDAAVVDVPADKQLAVSVDTMVEGIHFFANTSPEDLAHKLLTVNLSDMAAMGAEPKWATLALTLPTQNDDWLAAFSASLDTMASRFGVQVIGGDTTSGSLTLSLNIMGLLPKNKALTRSGAEVGDAVFVSNTVGDAALALHHLQGEVILSEVQLASLLPALNRPEPQVSLGLALLGTASACLDVSDGLVADLSHIAQSSGVSIELDVASVPVSAVYQQYLDNGGTFDLALYGGDDYQLAFTAADDQLRAIEQLSGRLGLHLSRIGQVVKKTDERIRLFNQGESVTLSATSGYQHFS